MCSLNTNTEMLIFIKQIIWNIKQMFLFPLDMPWCLLKVTLTVSLSLTECQKCFPPTGNVRDLVSEITWNLRICKRNFFKINIKYYLNVIFRGNKDEIGRNRLHSDLSVTGIQIVCINQNIASKEHRGLETSVIFH